MVSSAPDEIDYFTLIVGAAVFDRNGLPKEYFTTAENSSRNWVQTIFQALGLRSLLLALLPLENFQHVVIEGGSYWAIVMQLHSPQTEPYYLAMLLKPLPEAACDRLIAWARQLDLLHLQDHSRFRKA
jgi:hypothetical protein